MASKKLSQKKINAFQDTVYSFYKTNKRNLPWRFGYKHPVTPFMVFVSEIMLQQTQVDRVIPKFNVFIKKFPSFKAVSLAKTKEILSLWSGLGYNRRALYLKETCTRIYERYNAVVPKETVLLLDLPGVGPYTASALKVFIYNLPEVCIETNIRSAYIEYFFKTEKSVTDRELCSFIEMTLDVKNPREWYYALMDYGSFIKRQNQNPSRKSKGYKLQSKFKNSQRFFRGAIIKLLLADQLTEKDISSQFSGAHRKSIQKALEDLTKESFLVKIKNKYQIY